MCHRSLHRVALASLMMLSLGLAPAVLAQQRSPSTWDVPGVLKGKIKVAGQKEKLKGPVSGTMSLGPQGLLGPTDFELLLDDGVDQIGFPGTYGVGSKGKVQLTSDSQALANDIEALLASFGFPGISVTCDKVKVKAKVKDKRGVERMKVRARAKCLAEGLVKVGLAFKGEGIRSTP